MSRTKQTLQVGGKSYSYYSIEKAKEAGLSDVGKLPKSLKVLLENLLRYEGGTSVNWEDCQALNEWAKIRKATARSPTTRPVF